MFKKIKVSSVLFCLVILSSCSTYNPNGYINYQDYWFDGSEIYPQGYSNSGNYSDRPQARRQVVVPETYHVGSYHNPTSHKSRDRNWANSQNPRSYTIELANGQKASGVARQLHKAPKTERRAQIKYHRGGKTYYKGVYGTYSSPDAARKAMQALPDDVKKNANIKSWGSVQSSTGN